ncbi:matrix-remodeling-associated protein 7 isoform X1 [Haemorhous mexicanus]|uniref:matrix-remodeling-associated protein 7 isoform X1 n=1 Tax=Haemorhous mexicanus TaxID=30427 RepID=UPI0028BDAD5E|nr:matrix-remodeling-associated protein 7 isoform X1 [Haemorhous mexicanus]
MDLAVDLYLAVPLLFTVLALVLASVFLRLRGGGGERAAERPREPAAEPAREGGPGGEAAVAAPAAAKGPEDEESRVPVEEVGVGDEGKEAVTEQREAAAEPGPAAEPSPAAAESIPRQPPAEPRQPPAEPRQPPEEPRQPPEEPRQPPEEPRQPEHREDAESKIPPLGASPGSSLGHTGQAEDTSGHEALSSHAEEEEVDSENEKLVVREPEDEDAAEETFSFKYSPGKLRGNQYKSMMSKEELEEEQRVQREQLAAIFRLMKEKSDTFGEMSEGDMKEQLRLYDI